MLIVIVEDEPKIREGLVKTITKYTHHEIADIAVDGISGMKAIKDKNPDLIITDIRMPNMGGLEMLSSLEAEGIHVNAIVLTGYSDFDYARQAIKLGVIEYLLKPIDVENFITALKDVETKIKKRDMETVTVEQLLWSYLDGTLDKKESIKKQLSERLHINTTVISDIFLIKPESISSETISETIHIIERKLSGFCIENFHVWNMPREQAILVMMVDVNVNQNLKDLFQTRILSDIRELCECSCSYAQIKGMDNLDLTIENLYKLFDYNFSFGSKTVITEEIVNKLSFEDITYPDNLERELKNALCNHNYVKFHTIMDSFRDTVIRRNGNPNTVKEYTVRFSSYIYQLYKKYDGADREEFSFEAIIKRILDSKTKEELEGYQERIYEFISNSNSEKVNTDNGAILKVIAFIRNNYGNDITLSDAAELIGVTPEYLSQLFYKEVNVNFVPFLRNFRISVAKRLLDENRLKISEIAKQVGFSDAKYFNKVFKSVCGISPSDFKRGKETRDE